MFNEKGMSLLDAVILSGVLGVMVFGIITSIYQSQKELIKVTNEIHVSSAKLDVEKVLTIPELCKCHFGGNTFYYGTQAEREAHYGVGNLPNVSDKIALQKLDCSTEIKKIIAVNGNASSAVQGAEYTARAMYFSDIDSLGGRVFMATLNIELISANGPPTIVEVNNLYLKGFVTGTPGSRFRSITECAIVPDSFNQVRSKSCESLGADYALGGFGALGDPTCKRLDR